MATPPELMDTDAVPAPERLGLWTDWLGRLFQGLKSDQYGDTDFDGRARTLRAGEVVLKARISKTGQAMPQPGEFGVSIGPIKNQSAEGQP